MMIDWQLLNDMILKNGVISHHGDLYCDSILLKNINKPKIIELGAGTGGWPLSMLDFGITNAEWLLVDNFSWINDYNEKHHLHITKNWITNENDLIQNLSSKGLNCFSFINGDIYDIFSKDKVNQFEKKYNVLRIDCHVSDYHIDYLIENLLEEDNFIFIDDIRLNCGFERVYKFFDFINNRGYYPIWIGEKETLLHNNKLRALEIQSQLKDELDNNDATCAFWTETDIFKDDFTTVCTTPFRV